MWEHRSVSDKSFKETGRILPNETYVKLMDEVEAVVTRAQDDKFDAETFMTYIPRKGPWEEIPSSDHSRCRRPHSLHRPGNRQTAEHQPGARLVVD